MTATTFDAPTVIRTKRDGGALSDAAIDWVIDAYTHGAGRRRADVGPADGDLPARNDRCRDRQVDSRHGGFGAADGLFASAARRKATGVGRQAFHRRRRRQDHHPAGPGGDGVRRCGSAGRGPRTRAHRRDARQTGVDPGVHRRTVEKPYPPTTSRSGSGHLRGRRAGACRPQDLCAARRHRHHRVAAVDRQLGDEQEDRRGHPRVGAGLQGRLGRLPEDGGRVARAGPHDGRAWCRRTGW